MSTFYRQHKSRREKTLRRCAAMRAAKERKRMAMAVENACVGIIRFEGSMFGNREHVIRAFDVGEVNVLSIEIDGVCFRPRSARGLLRLLAKRLMGG